MLPTTLIGTAHFTAFSGIWHDQSVVRMNARLWMNPGPLNEAAGLPRRSARASLLEKGEKISSAGHRCEKCCSRTIFAVCWSGRAFDPDKEQFVRDGETNRYLTREYRKPYTEPARFDGSAPVVRNTMPLRRLNLATSVASAYSPSRRSCRRTSIVKRLLFLECEILSEYEFVKTGKSREALSILFRARARDHRGVHAASSLGAEMFSGSNLYPNPRTELMNWVWWGAASSFLRNRSM